LIGGIYGLRRRSWGLCLACSIVLIACGWGGWLIPAIMGVIALILVAVSKNDFY
jgi:hypothetical protein